MSELIVIGYPSPEKAEEVRHKLLELQGEYLVDLSDAVVATVDQKGRIKLNQLVHMWALGASAGSFWGLSSACCSFTRCWVFSSARERASYRERSAITGSMTPS